MTYRYFYCWLVLLLSLARSGAAQTLDPTFQPTTLLTSAQGRGSLSQVVPQADGQLLVTGTFASFNGQLVRGQMLRLNTDGSLAQNLILPAVTVSGNYASYGRLFPQPDGQVYAEAVRITASGLNFPGQGGGSSSYTVTLRRLRADNTLDPDFQPLLGGGSSWGPISTVDYTKQVLRFPTGQLLVYASTITGLGSALYRRLFKFESTGAPAAFALPSEVLTSSPFTTGQTASLPNQVAMQADGRVLIAYERVRVLNFGSYERQSGQLARVLADGSLDPDFLVAADPLLPTTATITTLLPLLNGQVLVAGSFTSFAGVTTPSGLVRLTSTGAVDPSFQAAAGLASLLPLAVLPDGRLLARANNQFGTACLVRLLSNGALDATFAPVTVSVAGFATSNWSVVLQPGDQKPILYGDFEMVGGQPRTGLARLNAATPLTSRAASTAGLVLRVYPIPAHERVTLSFDPVLAPGSELQLLDELGRQVRRQPVPALAKEVSLSLEGLPPGLYLLRCGLTASRLLIE